MWVRKPLDEEGLCFEGELNAAHGQGEWLRLCWAVLPCVGLAGGNELVRGVLAYAGLPALDILAGLGAYPFGPVQDFSGTTLIP